MPRDYIKSGIDYELEEQANKILRDDRKGVNALSEKKEILTDEQLNLRKSREVYSHVGTPDRRLISGLYRRAYNPLAGARPTRLRSSDD